MVAAQADALTPTDTVRHRLQVDGTEVSVTQDPYSDRVRCDHPSPDVDAVALGETLKSFADEQGLSRVVVLTPADAAEGLMHTGFQCEATMPGFYSGENDCAVLGLALDDDRADLANPTEVARVQQLLDETRPASVRVRHETTLASVDDAPRIAQLLGETFAEYPTPSDDPAYVAKQIEDGTPFRFVEQGGDVVACASADLVTTAETAELTDCATRPKARGQGLMQSLLLDLMEDLRKLAYPTAFTLARAREAGMNIAFQRLGFVHRGTMVQSCRIGNGIEDMNVWSRAL